MLFNVCNCGPALAANFGPLCGGGAGFVSAMIATLAASAKTAPAKTLRGEVPVVDRLAVRIVTDNSSILFVPEETRDGLAIERRVPHSYPDRPPRHILNAEWGLAMHAQSFAGGDERNVLIDFGFTPEVLNNNMAVIGVDPATFDAMVLEPRPLRPFRRHGRLPREARARAEEEHPVLRRRRGYLLPPPQSRAASSARSTARRSSTSGSHADDGVGAGAGRRPRLHHRPHRPGLVRETAASDRRRSSAFSTASAASRTKCRRRRTPATISPTTSITRSPPSIT